VISVFSFQVSASRLTAFHALRLTGVWWGLAHSGCSQHQSLTKQAIEQAVTFFSEYPLIVLSYSQAHFEIHLPVKRDKGCYLLWEYDNLTHRYTPRIARSAMPSSTEWHSSILSIQNGRMHSLLPCNCCASLIFETWSILHGTSLSYHIVKP